MLEFHGDILVLIARQTIHQIVVMSANATISTKVNHKLEETPETASIEWTVRVRPDATGELLDEIWSPEFGCLLRWKLQWDKTLASKICLKLLTPVCGVGGIIHITVYGRIFTSGFEAKDIDSVWKLFPRWDFLKYISPDDNDLVVIECTITAKTSPFEYISQLFTALNDKQFSNTVIVANGGDLHAASGVISSRCAILCQLFSDAASNPDEDGHSGEKEFLVMFKDGGAFELFTYRRYAAVEALLCYLYTGTCSFEMSSDEAIDLLALSNFCKLNRLKSHCEYVFAGSLTSQNAVRLLILAEEYSALFLKAHAIRHIMQHPKESVADATAWEDLELQHGTLRQSILMAHFTQDPSYTNFESPLCDVANPEDIFMKLNQTEFHDCDIVINNRHFTCHRAVLASRCPVFAAMLFIHDCKEKVERSVEITDISGDIFEELLRYIYTGVCFTVTEPGKCDEWQGLLIAADKYDLSELHQLCETELMRLVTEETALDLLPLADSHNAAKLRSVVLNFIVQNIFKFIKTAKWKTFVCDYCPFAAEVLTEVVLNTETA